MTERKTRCQYRMALWLLFITPALANADPVVDSVNGVRASGCTGGFKAQPLQQNARLDEVAHRMSAGASLRMAQQHAGYISVSSYSVSIGDVPDNGDVRHIIEAQFCAQATNPAFREIGVWHQGSDVWLAFAEPPPSQAQVDSVALRERVLQLLNSARAAPQQCGSAKFPPAPPLTRDERLEQAAQDYAQDMATFGYMDHNGRDGSTPQERVTRSGYHWNETGENLASGATSAEGVVGGWLRSPEHCANIMDPGYSQIGLGVALSPNPRNASVIYWALEFGHPARK